MRHLRLPFSLLCVLAAIAPAGTMAANPVVRVEQGRLGGREAGRVRSFKAIPFAAPPVGPLRWRPPQVPAGWQGVRDAGAFGPACLQVTGAMPDLPQSEDCLTLNVWAPAARPHQRLPVMVWVHGGGFVVGSGRLFDGASLAHLGVVLVTINYRLGRLGLFAHPGLVAEAGGGPTSDYGLMDQIAALRWVKRNIAAFGGDSGNVTLFGESAGSMALNYLLVSPEARGLFAKAISQSGFIRTPGRAFDVALDQGQAYARTLGVADADPAAAIERLRAMPAQAMMAPAKGLDAPDAPMPIIDGRLVPDQPYRIFAANRQLHIPMIIGATSYEASLWPQLRAHPEQTFDGLGAQARSAVADFGEGDPAVASPAIWTATAVTEPVRFLAMQQVRAGSPAWIYHFSELSPVRRGGPGAYHGDDVAYIFAGDDFGNTPTDGSSTHYDGQDRRIAMAMQAYWVAFAKAGDPASAGGPTWPRFEARRQDVMEFGQAGPVVRLHFERKRLDMIMSQVLEPCTWMYRAIRDKPSCGIHGGPPS